MEYLEITDRRMKNYLFTAVLFFLSALTAYGQKEVQPVTGYSSLELNLARSLWFNSSNAAGLALHLPDDYNVLSAAYNVRSGDYKLQQHGDRESRMKFNTSGALRTGKVALWGDFTFSNDFIAGSTYNTNLYDTYTDMPYYVADPNKSDWNKQDYDMSVKAAVPFWDDRLALGVGLNYFTKKGAKQRDPRSVVLCYGIRIEPAVVVKMATQHHLGISLLYENTFNRNTFINSKTGESQIIQLMKGLGNFSIGVVDGNTGIKPYYYPGNEYGGSLQYAFTQGASEVLLDLIYSTQTVHVFEEPTKPRRRGTTEKEKTGVNLQLIRRGETTHKLTLDLYQTDTDGIEYVQELSNNNQVQQWVTIAQYVKSKYNFRSASLLYDLFTGGAPGDYSWRTGLNAAYHHRQDEYITPNSRFNVKNCAATGFVKKNWSVSPSSRILLGLDVTYNLNLAGEYLYNGPDPESLIVTDFYAKDLNYLISDYLQTGCSLDWSFLLKSQSSVNIHLDRQWTKPVQGNTSRSYWGAAVAYIF
jgi:hypothetical protein